MTFNIALGGSRRASYWQNTEINWSEFVEMCRDVRRTSETMAQYDAMTRDEQAQIKDGAGFVGGLLVDGKRKKSSVESRTLLTLDADNAGGGFVFDVDLHLAGYAHLVYSTHSSRPDRPKMRIVAPLSREVTALEYAAVSRKLASNIGMSYFDRTTFDAERLMYLPSCSADAMPYFEAFEQGKPIDVDAILICDYADWSDESEWARHPEETGEIAAAKKPRLEDPREKAGAIGAFCREWTITEAIENFLPDVYAPTETPHRWTFAGGTTAGGLRVYDELWAWSEHQSDPANTGHCLNAFDLVRVHRFGHLDASVSVGTNTKHKPSFKAMLGLCDLGEPIEERVAEAGSYFDDKGKFIIKRFGDLMLEGRHVIVSAGTLYQYGGGKYAPAEDELVRASSKELGDMYSPKRVADAIAYIKTSVEQVTPDELISTGRYLNVANGLIDLETYKLLPHTPEIKTIIQLPTAYDPSAKAEAFDTFAHVVLERECIPIVEEMLGYCLIESMHYEKAFMLTGSGGNGKGSLIAAIEAMIGNKNTSSVSLQELSESRFAVADLYGKMVNLHADIPARLIEDSSQFKQLVSGDTFRADRKYEQSVVFANRAKIICSANDMPPSKDTSDGFHRRWVVVPFKRKFNDRALRLEMIADTSGLLNVALKGLKRLRAQGQFSASEATTEWAKTYRLKSDSAFAFISEHVILAEGKVLKQSLYDDYRIFCSKMGVFALSQQRFNAKLTEELPTVKEVRVDDKRYWQGISNI